MTREEAIKLLECSATELVGTMMQTDEQTAVNQLRRYVDAYDMAIAALREQGNCCKNGNSSWISVEERLPEDLPENQGKKVIPCLVSLKSTYPKGKPNTQKRQRQLQYYGSAGWVWEWSRIGSSRVTHWMPLPEPPKEEV